MRKRDIACTIKLDSVGRGVLITALNDLRNKRIEEGKTTEFVDEVLLKTIES